MTAELPGSQRFSAVRNFLELHDIDCTRSALRVAVVAVFALAVTSCGGGGDARSADNGDDPPPPPPPPVTARLTVTITGQGEVMTPDQTLMCNSSCVFQVDEGTDLTLNAVAAAGFDFNIWQGDCSDNADSPTCSLAVDADKNVFAGFKQRSTSNAPPQAAVSGDETGEINTPLQLSGAQSSDPDGDALTYQWTVVSTPALGNAVLGSPTEVGTTFQGDVPGIYVVSLIVNDGQESSLPAIVAIGLSVAAPGNTPPVAVITGNASGETQALLQLSGAQSSDADGDSLTYQWSVQSGPATANVVLGSPTLAQTTFQGDVAGIYAVSLVVHDGRQSSLPAAFQVELALPEPDSVAGTISVSPGNFDPGAVLSVLVSDADLDTDSESAQSVTVTAFNQSTNESELLTLAETGPDTGQFAGSVPTASGSAGASNNGQLLVQDGDIVLVEYQDAAPANMAITRAYVGDLALVADAPNMAVTNASGIGTAVTFGVVFAPDQFLANESPMIGIGPDSFDGQVNIMTRYPNGAAQHVLFSHIAPALAAGNEAPINFFIDLNSPPAEEMSLSDLPADYASGTRIELIEGGVQYSISVADAALVSIDEHFNGPLAAEWVLRGPLKSSSGNEHPWFTARFYVRLYSNGETATIPILQNVKAFRDNPAPAIPLESLTFKVAGLVRHSESNIAIGHHSLGTPNEVYWWSVADGPYSQSMYVLHDYPYMRDRAKLFPYINPARSYTNNWYQRALDDTRAGYGAQGLCLLNPNMLSSSWRGLVGPLPKTNLAWLMVQQPNAGQLQREQAYEIMIANALKMGTYHAQVEDEATNEPISIETYPTADIVGSIVKSPAGNWMFQSPVADTAHQPVIHAVPYFTTGWSHFLRQAKVWQTYNWLLRPNGSSRRPDPSRPEIWSETQSRSQAWINYNLMDLLRMMPSDDPDQDYWRTRFDNGMDWYYENYITPGTQRSELGFFTMMYPHHPRIQTSTSSFLALSFAHVTTVSEMIGIGDTQRIQAVRDYGLSNPVVRLMHPDAVPEVWSLDLWWVRNTNTEGNGGYNAPILQTMTEVLQKTFQLKVDNTQRYHPFPQRHLRGGMIPGGTFGSQARMDEINERIAGWHCSPSDNNVCLNAGYTPGDQVTYQFPPGYFDAKADPVEFPEGRFINGYTGWKAYPYYNQGALAAARDAGLPNAAAAWDRYRSFNNQWDFRDDQYQFDVIPRPD